MEMDHIGIVVKDLEKAIKFWAETFEYEQTTRIIENSRQKVWVVFMHKKNSLPIKLISPSEKSSTIYRFAQQGGGLHHLCFSCCDVTKEVKRLKECGLRILVDPEPGEAFQGENIAFLHSRFLGNVELIDTEKRCFLEAAGRE